MLEIAYMNAKLLIAGAACGLFAALSCAENLETCSGQSDRSTALSSIQLKSRTSEQSFYFRLGHFVAFVSGADIERLLKQRAALTGLEIDASLAKDVAKDVKSSAQVDLFKYVLSNPKYLPRLEFLMASSFDSGVLSLIDVWGRPQAEDVLTVKKISYASLELKKRIYCGAANELILDVTDTIS